MPDAPSVLVFSAHAADFVWRAGGAIALYASRGYRVRILCLSFGERGESQGAWKRAGHDPRAREGDSPRRVRARGGPARRGSDDSSTPATIRCARPTRWSTRWCRSTERAGRDRADTRVQRSVQSGPSGGESDLAQTRVYAQAEGYPLPGPALGAPPVFMFEPHQPEQCDFKPDVLLDVTPVGSASARRWSRWTRSGTSSTTTPT